MGWERSWILIHVKDIRCVKKRNNSVLQTHNICDFSPFFAVPFVCDFFSSFFPFDMRSHLL